MSQRIKDFRWYELIYHILFGLLDVASFVIDFRGGMEGCHQCVLFADVPMFDLVSSMVQSRIATINITVCKPSSSFLFMYVHFMVVVCSFEIF